MEEQEGEKGEVKKIKKENIREYSAVSFLAVLKTLYPTGKDEAKVCSSL